MYCVWVFCCLFSSFGIFVSFFFFSFLFFCCSTEFFRFAFFFDLFLSSLSLTFNIFYLWVLCAFILYSYSYRLPSLAYRMVSNIFIYRFKRFSVYVYAVCVYNTQSTTDWHLYVLLLVVRFWLHCITWLRKMIEDIIVWTGIEVWSVVDVLVVVFHRFLLFRSFFSMWNEQICLTMKYIYLWQAL